MSLVDLKDVSILVEGLDHPECVAWGPDGYLYAGGEAGQIYRISLTGEVAEIACTGGFILGVTLDGNGNIYACDMKRRAALRIDRDGNISTYSEGTHDRKMIQPNFAVFDAKGNLYVSDSGDWHGNNGCLFVVTPGGEARVASDELTAFPNGMALDSDGTYLYVVLSNLPGVVRLPIEQSDGLGVPQPVISLPGKVPDGLAFDQEGTLYISCYAPDVVCRLPKGGKLEVLVEDVERTLIASPTNIAFADSNLSTLVVSNLCGWHLAKMKAPVPGMPLRHPILP